MKKILIPFLFILITSTSVEAEEYALTALGESESIQITNINKKPIKNTLLRLLESCTVATNVTSIPTATYKGIRLTSSNGNIIEAHILPNSVNSYMVKIFTKDNGNIKLHGKYNDYAYQFIAMLELKI